MSEKFELIAAEKADPISAYPVRSMCCWLGVSTAGFYGWLVAEPSARARRHLTVTTHVKAAFAADLDVYAAIVTWAPSACRTWAAAPGAFALMLSQRGVDVVGLDPAGATLRDARTEPGAEQVRWVHGDATAHPNVRTAWSNSPSSPPTSPPDDR